MGVRLEPAIIPNIHIFEHTETFEHAFHHHRPLH
jgi:hypothetical protein